MVTARGIFRPITLYQKASWWHMFSYTLPPE